MYTVKCREKLKAMGAPLTGWYCVDVIDSEEANFSCELCGHERIRYIHIMAHDDFDQKLSVGCICAGNLEGDIFAAKERERKLKSKNRRKKTFLKKEWHEKNKTWRLYFKNQWLRIETASFAGKEYFKVYVNGECFQWKHSQRVTTLPAAKELVFDLMEDMK